MGVVVGGAAMGVVVGGGVASVFVGGVVVGVVVGGVAVIAMLVVFVSIYFVVVFSSDEGGGLMVGSLCTYHTCESGSCGFMWHAHYRPDVPTLCFSRV
uniref:Uncharacterized protein n=1 Tax=Fagus sylvatica TaxID=28930 RepID=A0A2N9H602_FAGSY